ncbi:CHAD domain containing protein [Thermomonospora curvata DSM 43183]|uniref:CHAD domain containing protein n=1 Tax=Thermomonospora curvata (strain ATCC 19995 / DSM 43183 / JCM 3096 / KCTC 9072 / NBRC 15933 / NCIMB 10081 / Henssen B9) TaxID=471852 RepID=D1A1E3_THECD|nr:CHAD domain containing protein [Thermomonospora curvata DSM 43183]
MADPKSQLEVERKYDADRDFTLPDLSGLPGVASVSEPRTHVLIANYFDTCDHRLAARGITLRRRRGGADAGWHLKIPVAPDSKNELRASLGRPQVVPAKLARLVAVHVRGAQLRPVAVLETERTVILLRDAGGRLLAEVADDTVTGRLIDSEGAEQPGTTVWREIEIELGPAGTPELLRAAGERLQQAGARPASGPAKLGRVLEPVMAVPFGGHRRALPDLPAGSAGAAVIGYLAKQVDAVISYDPKARLAEFDAVHKMRVAVRRIRSALRSYAPLLDPVRIAPLEPELRWLAEVLGEVRDLEVLRMRFTDRLERPYGLHPAASQSWLEALSKREKSAYRRMNTTLTQPRYFALLDALDALVADPPLSERAFRPAVAELPRLVTRQWRRLTRKYEAIATAKDPEEARHDARKAAKRARYAAELAAAALRELKPQAADGARPAKGKGKKRKASRRAAAEPARSPAELAEIAAQTAAHAKRLQEVLGGYQDGVIAMQHLRAAAAERSTTPAEAFVLGVLYGIERCEALESLSRVEATWEQTAPPAF